MRCAAHGMPVDAQPTRLIKAASAAWLLLIRA